MYVKPNLALQLALKQRIKLSNEILDLFDVRTFEEDHRVRVQQLCVQQSARVSLQLRDVRWIINPYFLVTGFV